MLENICSYGTTFSLTVTPLCSDSNFVISSVKEVSSDLLAQVVNVSEPESAPPLPLPPPKPEQLLSASTEARDIAMRVADLFLLNFTLRSPCFVFRWHAVLRCTTFRCGKYSPMKLN